MAKQVKYTNPPTVCDICPTPIYDAEGEEFIDGRTTVGPWAIMCPECYLDFGVGIGPGKGQRYEYIPNEDAFIKIEG